MEIDYVIGKVKEARQSAPERKFTQTFDLVINLQSMDLRKPEHKIDIGISLNSNIKPKKLKICAVIDHSIEGSEKVFDKVLYIEDLMALKGNIKEIRKITHNFDKFVVQANVMPQFAQILGRYLGPMNKMPSPKLGMVITNKTPLQELNDKLQKLVHLQTKKNLVLQASIGSEKESDETIAKNIIAIRESLLHSLPNQQNNLKDMNLKLTMGRRVLL